MKHASAAGRAALRKQASGLTRIPGVGPAIASDLNRLGIHEVGDLRGRNPEALYSELCERIGRKVDRCVLYTFRCAVYFASETDHDPELLKWWNWKDAASKHEAVLRRGGGVRETVDLGRAKM